MPNLKIWINEKKYPTKIEFCCDEMAGAMCRHQVIKYTITTKRNYDDPDNPFKMTSKEKCPGIRISRDYNTFSCCPFCKGDIEFI